MAGASLAKLRRRARPVPIVALVGRRVREFRLERGWAQVDLEAHMEGRITRSQISYIENGERHVSLRTLAMLAEALEVHPAELLLDPRASDGDAAVARLLHPPPHTHICRRARWPS